MTRKTKRIYYGPDEDPTLFWWDVEWSNATKSVVINGSLLHAIEGMPGHSVGCRLSNAAVDKENAKAFPHPVYLAAFYKRTALIVDDLAKNGTPVHAVVYDHDYANFVNMNDAGTMEDVYKDKRFYLRVPRNRSDSPSHENKNKQPPKNGGGGDGSGGAPAFKVDINTGHPASSLPENGFHPSVTQNKAAFRGAMGRAKYAGRLGRAAAAQLSRTAKRVDGNQAS